MKRALSLSSLVPRPQKPKLESAPDDLTALATDVQLHCIECGRHDGLAQGTWAACGIILPVWSVREIKLYMTASFMQSLLEDMQAYLRLRNTKV